MAGIDDLINQLAASGNYKAPSLQYTAPVTTASTGANWADIFNSLNKSNTGGGGLGAASYAPTAASASSSLPLWRKALNQIDKPRAIVDNLLNDMVQSNPTKGWKGALEDFIGYNPIINGMTAGLPALITHAIDPNSIKAFTGMHPIQDIKQGLTNDPASAQFGDILDNLGYKAPSQNAPEWQKIAHGAANFAGNVVTDPLSYVTFGAGGVAKAGVEGALDVAKSIAEDSGVDIAKGAGKDIDKLATGTASNVYDKTLQDKSEQGINPDLAKRFARKKFSDTYNQILNAGKEARAKSGNSLVNFDIPFTHISIPLINKPKALQLTELPIAEEQAQGVRAALSAMGKSDPVAQDALLSSKYGQGVTAETMTPQMYQNFRQIVSSVPKAKSALPDADITQSVEQEMVPTATQSEVPTYGLNIGRGTGLTPKLSATQQLQNLYKAAQTEGLPPGREYESLQDLLSRISDRNGVNLDQLIKNSTDEPTLKDILSAVDERNKGLKRLGYSIQDFFPRLFKQTGTKTVTSMEPQAVDRLIQTAKMTDKTPVEDAIRDRNINKAFSENPYVADMAGRTPIGHGLNKLLGWVNPRNGKGADEVWDAQNAVLGQRFNLAHNITPLMEKDLAKLTPAERGLVMHLNEGVLPKNLTPAEQAAIKALKNGTGHADIMKKVLADRKSGYAEMLQNEVKAGTLEPKKALQNYEYMMLNPNMSEEDAQTLMKDPLIQKYGGHSMANKSNLERGVFKNHAQWRDAVDSIRSQLGKETDPAAKAELQDRLSKLENMYETDPLKTYVARASRSIRSSNYGQLFKDLREQGFVRNSLHGLSKEAREQYKPLKGEEGSEIANLLGLKQGEYIHKDVLNGLSKADKMFQGENVNKIINNLESVWNIWKAGPIIYSPTHLKTRFMGDVLNSMLGGAKLKNFKNAWRISKLAKEGKLTGEYATLYKKAIDNGIVNAHSGQLGVIMNDSIAKGNRIQQLENKVYNNRVGKVMSKVLNGMDNQARLALFLHGMETYGDAKQAATLVRKFLFNYNELSNADRAIRTVVPFWTWTRNNLPLMLEQFAKQPRYFQAYNRLATQLQGTQPTEPYADDYLHVGGDYFFNPHAPLQDLDMLDTPRQEILGNLANPIMVSPFEGYTNQNFFDHMPIDKFTPQGSPAPFIRSLEFTLQQMGAGGASNLMNALSTPNSKKPIGEKIFNNTIGGLSQQNPTSIAKENAYQRKEQLAMQKKREKAQAQAGG